MHSIQQLLDMIATETTGDGLPREHHFDESLNEDPFVDLESDRKSLDLHPLIYNLELIQSSSGALYWVE